MNIEVILTIEEENFDDLSDEKQLEFKNKVTDKVESWVIEIIKKKIKEGNSKEYIEQLLGIN